MIFKTNIWALICCVATIICLSTQAAYSQNQFEKELTQKIDNFLAPAPQINRQTTPTQNELYPSDAPGGILIPSGFGGYGTYLFGGIGATYPEVYLNNNKTDLITSVGACVGNPAKAVNFAASLNMTDVHKFRDFSGNFIISRILFAGTSISAGALQVFANVKQSDASGSTYFLAVTHAIQTIKSLTPGCSRLSYTIGIGSGRFYEKSPKDIAAGRGKHGTAVFGSISYELIQHVNVNAEWTGMNLGISAGVRPFPVPLSLAVGVANLTRYTNDRANMVFSLGYPLSLNRR
ncbi:hypothetical protein SAMN05192574_108228 [Mucilaginibacter gossypiicola]|uniref:Outer membrane protein beta-barrel domain-containing protein n=1 Tax=Mucilaginibacter gossypiicola TaxID=551995 RepID=A0A1H8Q0V5_9SPHI|nr:hypothetical protein [Mucilaginibacter gossypiicola]SEO47862.1 hypothetical protein SAMN05192574_108228 [Mucilaginibacter gossypiicola]